MRSLESLTPCQEIALHGITCEGEVIIQKLTSQENNHISMSVVFFRYM